VVLTGRAPTFVPHVRERADFSLRGLITCPHCGKAVTGSISTGKAGNKFGYYRCHRVNGHMNVRAEVVEREFVDMLNRLTPKPERMALIERVFRASWADRNQVAAQESAALKRELATEEARKRRVLNQMADGVLSHEDFASMNNEATEKIADLRMRLALSQSGELDLETAIEYLNHLLWNTSTIWQTSDLQGKQKLQRRLFPKGLTFEKTGFGTPVTHSIYTLLVSDSVDAAELVAPQGFEPRSSESESLVLPLNEGAPVKNLCRRRERTAFAD
jgi:site-specific DNA recombinase